MTSFGRTRRQPPYRNMNEALSNGWDYMPCAFPTHHQRYHRDGEQLTKDELVDPNAPPLAPITLDEAITCTQLTANHQAGTPIGDDHKQLAKWLLELKQRRQAMPSRWWCGVGVALSLIITALCNIGSIGPERLWLVMMTNLALAAILTFPYSLEH